MYSRTRLSRRRTFLRCAAVTAVLSASTLGAVAEASPTTTTTSTTTAPGATITPLTMTTGARFGLMIVISCTRIGSCAAGGYEQLSTGKQRAILSVETNDVWGSAQIVGASLSAQTASITHLACPRAGACVALGEHLSPGASSSSVRFSSYLVTQHGSRWSTAQLIPTRGFGAHPSYLITGMACAQVASCVMTGTLLFDPNHTRVFALTWRHGHWSAPHFFTGAQLGRGMQLASINSLSCVGAWCEGVGEDANASHLVEPFTVTYVGGLWHSMRALGAYRAPANTNALDNISCSAVGTCVAGGFTNSVKTNGEAPLVVEENHGHWSAPYILRSPASTVLQGVSCTGPTACTAVVVHAAGGELVGLAAMRANHHWNVGGALSVPGWSNLQGWTISCVPGQCEIAGGAAKIPNGLPLPLVFAPTKGA